jgi:hypothetical protein
MRTRPLLLILEDEEQRLFTLIAAFSAHLYYFLVFLGGKLTWLLSEAWRATEKAGRSLGSSPSSRHYPPLARHSACLTSLGKDSP